MTRALIVKLAFGMDHVTTDVVLKKLSCSGYQTIRHLITGDDNRIVRDIDDIVSSSF
jgi:hypothetical protein